MWKTVLVGTESTVTLENGWLTVAQSEKSVRLPIDDVYSVVIDNPRCRCSVASMNALTQAGAHLVFCDEKHFPAAVVLPPEGSIHALLITEKQYENMILLLGERYAEESYLDSGDLLEL